MKDVKMYSSSDLCEVTSLALSNPIEKIDKTEPKKVVFFFKDSKELQEKLKSYKDKKLSVEPQEFFEQIRAVKTMIYERKQRAEQPTVQKESSNTD